MQELGNAINDSLSESDRIAEAIGEIKKAGYDVFLVLEATIGFNRREEGSENEEDELEVTEEPKRNFEATSEIKKAGYDVFLVLEATIGFNRREEGSENEEDELEVTEEPKRNFEAT